MLISKQIAVRERQNGAPC